MIKAWHGLRRACRDVGGAYGVILCRRLPRSGTRGLVLVANLCRTGWSMFVRPKNAVLQKYIPLRQGLAIRGDLRCSPDQWAAFEAAVSKVGQVRLVDANDAAKEGQAGGVKDMKWERKDPMLGVVGRLDVVVAGAALRMQVDGACRVSIGWTVKRG